MNPYISIVVPVYKVEHYLSRCLQSLSNQTYRDFEVILVDDGSPDRCPQICDEWVEKDTRFHVIHQENNGVSSARNRGLQMASGRYIGFVDPDDWVDDDLMQRLVENIDANPELDLLVYGCVNTFVSNGQVVRCAKRRVKETQISSTQYFKDHFFEIENNGLGNEVWNKLFRAELIQNMRFREDMAVAEDLFFCIDIYPKVRQAKMLDWYPYHFQNVVNASKGYLSLDYNGIVERRKHVATELLAWGVDRNQVEEYLLRSAQIYAYETLHRLFSPQFAKLSYPEKIQHVQGILNHPLLQKSLDKMRIGNQGRGSQLLYWPIRWNWSRAVYWLDWLLIHSKKILRKDV